MSEHRMEWLAQSVPLAPVISVMASDPNALQSHHAFAGEEPQAHNGHRQTHQS